MEQGAWITQVHLGRSSDSGERELGTSLCHTTAVLARASPLPVHCHEPQNV